MREKKKKKTSSQQTRAEQSRAHEKWNKNRNGMRLEVYSVPPKTGGSTPILTDIQ